MTLDIKEYHLICTIDLVSFVLEGVSPTESGFKCQTCDEPLPQVFKQKEICASTPKESTTVSLKINSISSTEHKELTRRPITKIAYKIM